MEERRACEVLKDFEEILYEFDPMLLGSTDRSEYESEALSILARFHESGVLGAPDDARFELAASIVTETLEYWFDEAPSGDCSPLVARLLSSFTQKA